MSVKKDKVKVLIVDDNEDFSANMKDLAELNGFEAKYVTNGERAITEIEKDPSQVVLLDIKLPGIDGVATFRKLKKIAPSIKVIVTSGYGFEERMDEATQEGAIAAFPKPFDIGLLFNLIRKEAVT